MVLFSLIPISSQYTLISRINQLVIMHISSSFFLFLFVGSLAYTGDTTVALSQASHSLTYILTF